MIQIIDLSDILKVIMSTYNGIFLSYRFSLLLLWLFNIAVYLVRYKSSLRKHYNWISLSCYTYIHLAHVFLKMSVAESKQLSQKLWRKGFITLESQWLHEDFQETKNPETAGSLIRLKCVVPEKHNFINFWTRLEKVRKTFDLLPRLARWPDQTRKNMSMQMNRHAENDTISRLNTVKLLWHNLYC